MLVSRPITMPKILGGEARGRKKVRMATKWDTVLAILEGVVPPLPPFLRLLADLTEIVLTVNAELESV